MKSNQFNKSRTLVCALMLASAATLGQLSAASSVNLGLSGAVPPILELSVQGSGGASTLTPSSNTSGEQIAVVFETCNDADGYTVTMVSTNGDGADANTGVLLGTDEGETLTYTVSYNESAISLTDGTAVVTDASSKTAASGVGKILRVTYDGSSSNLAADTYTDTLTFSIAAK